MKKKSVLLFVTAYLAYSAVYVCRLNLSVAAPVLQSVGMMTKAQIGWLSSAFFITYSLGQLFNGWLGDRLKARNMICTGLFLAGICNVIIGVLPPYVAIFVLWAVNGYAQSMVWGPLLRTVSASFSKEKGQYIASLLISSVAVGSVISIVLASCSASMMGICFAFILPGCVTLVICGLVLLFFRAEEPAKMQKKSSLKELFFEPKILLILLPAMIHGVLKDNINLWAPSYFVQTFQTSISGTAFYVLIIPLISLGGRLVYPVIYKVCHGREHLVTRLALGISAVSLVPLCIGANPVISVICLSIAAAAISVVNTSILSIYPMNFKKEGSVSSVAGIMDFATYMGAGISSAVYGYVLEFGSFESMYVSWIALCLAGIVILVKYERKYGYEKISDREPGEVLQGESSQPQHHVGWTTDTGRTESRL